MAAEIDLTSKYMAPHDDDPNFAAGILPICTKTNRALICLRSGKVDQPYTWGTWGGKIKKGENFVDGAKREFNEESGFTGSIKLVPAYLFKQNKFEFQNFIGLVGKEFIPKPSWEFDDYAWCNYQELWEIEPKHFGLDLLLEHSGKLINKYLLPNDYKGDLVEKILEEWVRPDYQKDILLGLKREARKFSNYDDFERYYSIYGNHGIYYHLTDNPDWKYDVNKGSRDMSSMASGKVGEKGSLMVTSDLEHWNYYYNYDDDDKPRPDATRKFVAIIDLGDVNIPSSFGRGFGHEIYLGADKMKKAVIIGVMPLSDALKFHKRFKRMMPQSKEELKKLWLAANKNKILKDEYGLPTINGKSILKIRIAKLMPKKKATVKESLTVKILKEAESDDTEAYNKTMAPYQNKKTDFINSLKSFKDFDDNKIQECLDYFGYEGSNDEEDAFEEFKEKIDYYKKMSDPVILYRVIGVKNKKIIDTNEMGEHYTPYEWNIDDDMLLSIGMENWDDGVKPYVMKVSAPLSEIDIAQTIIQNLSFPTEWEINLKNKGKGAKFIKAYKLK